MQLGIIQGRLSNPEEGFQECPKDWKREFSLLKKIGLGHIEWIVTFDNFHSNPLFNENISGYSLSSVCADFMVHEDFLDNNFLDNFFDPFCKKVMHNNYRNITIPLLEKSNVDSTEKRNKLISILNNYAANYSKINFNIEAELESDKLLEIVSQRPNIFVTYDTGNITSCGFDHYKYIMKIKNKISQVHLKDRKVGSAETFFPGKGDTNFKLVFDILKQIGFSGEYTLQTSRGNSGEEIDTIKKHKLIMENYYNG